MRTLHNYIDDAKRRKEDGEAGFSLIELIIVVVILGILVAIAVPIFAGIQETARNNSLKSIASSAASAVAAGMATDPATVTALGAVPVTVYKTSDATLLITGDLTLGGFCVEATGAGALADAVDAESGPGC